MPQYFNPNVVYTRGPRGAQGPQGVSGQGGENPTFETITTSSPTGGLSLNNGTQAKVGAHNGMGAGGISLLCTVGYELNWQAGVLQAYQFENPNIPVPIYLNSVIVPLVTTLVNLPTASSVGHGARAFITDSAVVYDGASVGDIAVGDGSNKVPVYSDGTDWRIGG